MCTLVRVVERGCQHNHELAADYNVGARALVRPADLMYVAVVSLAIFFSNTEASRFLYQLTLVEGYEDGLTWELTTLDCNARYTLTPLGYIIFDVFCRLVFFTTCSLRFFPCLSTR